MSKPRKKRRPPKRVLALPDLNNPKRRYLTPSRQRAASAVMIAPYPISSIGTAQNRVSHSTVPWFCDTFSSRRCIRRQPSISAWVHRVVAFIRTYVLTVESIQSRVDGMPPIQ